MPTGGGGLALDSRQRARFEPALGRDLSQVRLHADAAAAGLAASQLAGAVTIGTDIFFGAGAYPLATKEGERLLSHELAHVVQGLGGNGRQTGPADAEAAAERAADAVAQGKAGIGLRPVIQPALARAPKTWKELVLDAKAEPDLTRRSTAMVALIRRAVSGMTVREAGTSSPSGVDPADYDAAPIINFDVRLSDKLRWHSTTKKVGGDAGYTFTTGIGGSSPHAYSVLGPLALDADGGEIWTQMYANHELFHAAHQATSTGTYEDQEVEAWTDSFIHYFLPTYLNRDAWIHLINNYGGANASFQAPALARLVTFATALSTAPDLTIPSGHSDRQKFEIWLKRRMRDMPTAKLVVDLSAKLGIVGAGPVTP